MGILGNDKVATCLGHPVIFILLNDLGWHGEVL